MGRIQAASGLRVRESKRGAEGEESDGQKWNPMMMSGVTLMLDSSAPTSSPCVPRFIDLVPTIPLVLHVSCLSFCTEGEPLRCITSRARLANTRDWALAGCVPHAEGVSSHGQRGHSATAPPSTATV